MDSAKRRETITELAMRAKTDNTAIPELWGMVESFIQAICRRYCRNGGDTRLYEFSDLCQNAYFSFLRAVKAFDPERGAFSTYLHYYIRDSCSREVKRYQGKAALIYSAQSLSKPLDGTDGLTLSDMLPDMYTPERFEAIEIEMMAGVILAEADTLPNIRQRRIIRECTYQGRTLQSIADEFGITREGARMVEETAIKALRRRPIIRDMQQEYHANVRESARESAVDPYRVKSSTVFHSDFTSAVEAIILRMEG